MDYEKKQPTADCIVARLVPSWGSRVSLLFKTTEPYEHYYDEHGEEVPYGAIASWTDVELPPETESEDEKVRKSLLAYIKGASKRLDTKKWIAYLEKQKEPLTPEEKMNHPLYLEGFDVGRKVGEEAMRPKEWSDNFEENIRILLHEKLKWTSDDRSMYSAVFIDDKTLKDIISGIWFYVGKEALKYPDKQLNVEQKPAEWSEEDERKLNRIYEILGYAADDKGFLASKRIIGDKEAIELQDFLIKFLRPQPHWQPSEEQMEALKAANLYWRGVTNITPPIRILESLYNGLKKLM